MLSFFLNHPYYKLKLKIKKIMITTPEKEQKNTGFYNNDNEMSGLTASHLNNLCYILKIILNFQNLSK